VAEVRFQFNEELPKRSSFLTVIPEFGAPFKVKKTILRRNTTVRSGAHAPMKNTTVMKEYAGNAGFSLDSSFEV
jgi:hypothetical protein